MIRTQAMGKRSGYLVYLFKKSELTSQYSFPEANSPLWRVLGVLRGCIMISGFMKL